MDVDETAAPRPQEDFLDSNHSLSPLRIEISIAICDRSFPTIFFYLQPFDLAPVLVGLFTELAQAVDSSIESLIMITKYIVGILYYCASLVLALIHFTSALLGVMESLLFFLFCSIISITVHAITRGT